MMEPSGTSLAYKILMGAWKNWSPIAFLFSVIAYSGLVFADQASLCREALLEVSKSTMKDSTVWFTANEDGSAKPAGSVVLNQSKYFWKKVKTLDEARQYAGLFANKIFEVSPSGFANIQWDPIRHSDHPRSLIGKVIGGASISPTEVFNFFGIVTHYYPRKKLIQILSVRGYPILVSMSEDSDIRVLEQSSLSDDQLQKIKKYSLSRRRKIQQMKNPEILEPLPSWIKNIPGKVENISFTKHDSWDSLLNTEGQVAANVPGVGKVWYWKTDRPEKERTSIVPSEFFDKLEGKSILDAGCGGGNLVEYLKIKYPDQKIIGIDLHLNSDQSQKNYYIQGDLTETPFKDAEFDMIYSIWSVFSYNGLDIQAKALREFYRILKPGGTVRLGAPSLSHIVQIIKFVRGFEITAIGNGLIELTKSN